MKTLTDLFANLLANDLAGWVTAGWSIAIWPFIVWWWKDRKRSHLPGLDIVRKRRGEKPIKIDGHDCRGIQLNFVNKTGQIVYLTHVAIIDYTKEFEPTEKADQNVTDGSCELKFLDAGKKDYSLRQIILQTNEQAQTVLPVVIKDEDAFVRYRRGAMRTFFRRPKYFRLEFVVMAGEVRRRVSVVY